MAVIEKTVECGAVDMEHQAKEKLDRGAGEEACYGLLRDSVLDGATALFAAVNLCQTLADKDFQLLTLKVAAAELVVPVVEEVQAQQREQAGV